MPKSTLNPIIVPYRGYASEKQSFIKGRVFKHFKITKGHSVSRWRNAIDSYRRFATRELANISIEITVGTERFLTQSDREGYFQMDRSILHQFTKPDQLWIPAKFNVVYSSKDMTSVEGEILSPSINSAFGIISDIDDTLLQTDLGRWLNLRTLYLTFIKDGHQRQAIKGMVDVIQRLSKGTNQTIDNPIFYVSHSPWNLYDIIEEFMDAQGLPKGPIMLRDIGLRPSGAFKKHKVETISHILESYPDMKFVLLGDTVSSDTDHYLHIAKQYPGRIKAIFIRKSKNSRNAKRVSRLIESTMDIPIHFIHDPKEILEHGIKMGIVAAD